MGVAFTSSCIRTKETVESRRFSRLVKGPKGPTVGPASGCGILTHIKVPIIDQVPGRSSICEGYRGLLVGTRKYGSLHLQ